MSLIAHTKQGWKIYLFISLMAIGAGITLLQSLFVDALGKELTTNLAIGGMVLIIATLVWAGQNIACPKCGRKLLIYAITKVGLGTWYNWLMAEEKCPGCGYTGKTNDPPKGNRSKGRNKR